MLVALVVVIASNAHNILMNREYLQLVADNIKKKRKELKLTQEDLESENVSRSMISLIEIVKTDFTISTAKAIADSMGIKVRDLFDFELEDE